MVHFLRNCTKGIKEMPANSESAFSMRKNKTLPLAGFKSRNPLKKKGGGTKNLMKIMVLTFFWAMVVGGVMMPDVARGQITPVQPPGSGSSTSPYLITTEAHLAWLKQQTEHSNNASNNSAHPVAENKYWALGANITWNNGSSAGVNRRIGYNDRPFRGHFDGRGYKITMGNISATTTNYVGFFGQARNVTIQNLTIDVGFIAAQDQVGVLVGEITGNATIQNVHVTQIYPYIYGSRWGGLIGHVWGTGTVNISSCSAITNIALISNSSGTTFGGLIGGFRSTSEGGNMTISDCLSEITFSGITNNNIDIGGLIGVLSYGKTVTVRRTVVRVSGLSASDLSLSRSIGSVVGYLGNTSTLNLRAVYNNLTNTVSNAGMVGQRKDDRVYILGVLVSGSIATINTTNVEMITSWTGNTNVYNKLERRNNDGTEITSTTTIGNEIWGYDVSERPKISKTGYAVQVTRGTGVASISGHRHSSGTQHYVNSDQMLTVSPSPAPNQYQRVNYTFTPAYNHSSGAGTTTGSGNNISNNNFTATQNGDNWHLTPRVNGTVSATIINIPYPTSEYTEFNTWASSNQVTIRWSYNNPQGSSHGVTGRFHIYRREGASGSWNYVNSFTPANGSGLSGFVHNTLSVNDFNKSFQYLIAFTESTGTYSTNPEAVYGSDFCRIITRSTFVPKPNFESSSFNPFAANNQITIAWNYNNPNNVGGRFWVYRREGTTGSWGSSIGNVAVNTSSGYHSPSLSFTIAASDFNKSYQYLIVLTDGVAAPTDPGSIHSNFSSGAFSRSTFVTIDQLNFSSVTATGGESNITVSFSVHSEFTNSTAYSFTIQQSTNDGSGYGTYNDWLTNQRFDGRTTPYEFPRNVGGNSCIGYRYKVIINAFGTTYSRESEEARVTGILKFVADEPFNASKGEHANYVRLQWKMDKLPGVSTDTYRIFRRIANSNTEWDELETITSSASTLYWNDVNALTGVYYQYKITPYQICEGIGQTELEPRFSVGFTQASGIVSGRVTYGTGTAVEGVNIFLNNRDLEEGEKTYRSLKSIGGGGKFEWLAATNTYFNNIWTPAQYTLQFWVRPDGTNTGTVDIGNFGNCVIRMIAVTGGYQIFTSWNTATTARSAIIPANYFSHITITRSGSTVTIRTINDQNPDDIQFNTTTFTHTAPGNQTAANSRISFGHAFRGYIDEVRFWNRALGETEIRRDYSHYLVGNETGLRGYWKFDENLYGYAFDMSRIGTVYNANHATTNTLTFDQIIPEEHQLALKGITDHNGNYMINGIPYVGECTSYTIVPSLGIHQFNPSQHLRFISQASMVHNGTDFLDISSFPVTGKVTFANSNYPVDGVTISINGQPAIEDGKIVVTKPDGTFKVDVPIGEHFITLSKSGHEFADGGRFPANPHLKHNFQSSVNGLEFSDNTTVRIMGRVVGGQPEAEIPLGFGLSNANIGQATVTLHTVNETYSLNLSNNDRTVVANIGGKPSETIFKSTNSERNGIIEIKTNPETGEFVAMLPPVPFNILSSKTKDFDDSGSNNDFYYSQRFFSNIDPSDLKTAQFTNAQGNLQTFEYHDSVKITRYNDPSIIVRDLGATEGAFGDTFYRYIDNVIPENTTEILLYSKDESTGEIEYALNYPVFSQVTGNYVWEISAYEEYVNRDVEHNPKTSRVPIAGLQVDVDNGLASHVIEIFNDGSNDELTHSQQILVLDTEGKVNYRFNAGFPKLGGDHLLSSNISIFQNGKRHFWDKDNPLASTTPTNFLGYLLGMRPTDGDNFVTEGPAHVDIVLHDPPGSNSYAFIEKGTSIISEVTNTLQVDTNEEIGATLHLGPKFTTETGFLFISVGTEVETILDTSLSMQWSQSYSKGNSIITTTTFNENISTSSDPNYVGSMADVYIGKSTNRTFAKQRNLALYPAAQAPAGTTVGTGDFKLYMKEVTAVGQNFSTAFTYTQNYIVNTLIPNIRQLRNGLLVTVSVIPSPQEVTFGSEKNPLYFTTLSDDDDDFGNPGTYTVYFAPDATTIDKKLDMVADYNLWITNWERIISNNEEHKIDLFDLRPNLESLNQMYNRSFDSGVNISESISVSFEDTEITYVMNSTGLYNENHAGIRIGGIGLVGHVKLSVNVIQDTTTTNTTANNLTFGYVLATDGINDALSVDIYKPVSSQMMASVKPESEMRNLHGYTFRRRAGQTSCPHEAEELTLYFEQGEHTINDGTFKIENPDLYINNAKTATIANISTGREASFSIEMQNLSEINTTVTYQLWVDDMTNPNGLIISIDGTPLTSPRNYTIPYGTPLTKIVRVKQSSLDILDYEGIKLVMGSACDDNIYDEVSFNVYFTPASSPVTLSANTTVANCALLESGGIINFIISDYDRNFRNFGKIQMQYRNVNNPNPNAWITTKEYVNDEELYPLSGDMELITGHIINYDFTFTETTPTDGDYLFRALTVSKIGYDEIFTSSEEIQVTKDVNPPRPLGLPSPASGILGIGDEISITFNEDIQSGMLTPSNFNISGILNAQLIAEPNVGLAFTGGAQNAKTELPIFVNGSFSIETWYKRDPNTAGTLFAFGANQNFISLGFNSSGNAVLKLGNETYTSVTATSNDETWKYVALCYDRDNNSVAVYQFEGATDNVLFAAQPLFGTPETQGRLIVGNNENFDNGFNGVLSQAHFFGKKRTFSEVTAEKSIRKSGREFGLTGYWLMDEGVGTIAEDKARSRNLMLNADWYIYPSGYALRTNNNWFSIPVSTYPLNSFRDFTLEFWFRSETVNQKNQTLFSCDAGTIGLDENSRLVLFRNDGTVNQIMTSNSLSDTKWRHIAMSVRRGGSVNVYIDGVSSAVFPETMLGSFASGHYYFGAKRSSDNTYSQHFNGYFDEIRIWNSALTRESIRLNKNSKLYGNEAGLIAYYPFEIYQKQPNGLITVTPSNKNMTDDNSASGVATFSTTAVSVKDVRPVENVPFTYVASNNKIVFTLSPDYFARVEGTILNISVSNVRDMRNNKSNTEQWTAFVNRNPLKWETDPVSIIMEEGNIRQFTARITNIGGTIVSYSIENLPNWLSVSSGVGNLSPLASRDLTFTVFQGVNIGNYEAGIGLTSGNGVSEILPVSLKVTGQRPDWNVNPADFESSMNIIGQIKIDSVFQEDTDDILAAFIGTMCVGVASPVYLSSNNAYFTFANIYGNPHHNNQPLTFKLWDASTGRIYPKIRTSIDNIRFAPSLMLGSISNPVIFDALDVTEQTIMLSKGWNWVSTNVLSDNPSILSQMKTSLIQTGEIIKGRDAFIQQPGWVGTLTSVSEKTMYQIRTTADHSLILEGQFANPATTPIDINYGWNHIGYIPSFTLPVNNALAGINAKVDDQIKGQSGFAVYAGSNGWIGNLTFMQSGKGYMYFSGTAQTQILIYPSSSSHGFIPPKSGNTSQVEPKWTINPGQYSNSMTITAIVVNDDIELRSDFIEIGAFNGEECRGTVFLHYVESLNRYIGFLMIYGNGNEQIKLKVFDHETDTEYDANNAAFLFASDAIFGNPARPYIIGLGTTVGIDNISSQIALYPNPVSSKLYITYPHESIDIVEITDLSGRLIIRKTNFAEKSIDVSGIVKGVYMLKLISKEQINVMRFVKE